MRVRQRAFTLLEVLIALGIGSLVLGTILSSTSSHLQRLARLEPRYRNLVVASVALEEFMATKGSGSKTDTLEDIEYTVTVSSVPSDPRIDSVQSRVEAGRGLGATVTAYRLRQSSQENSSSNGSQGEGESGQ